MKYLLLLMALLSFCAPVGAFDLSAFMEPPREREQTFDSPQPVMTVRIPNLDRTELRKLANHDVTVMVDKSGSMQERDCGVSRWQWSENQISFLSYQAAPVLNRGIRVVLFDSGTKVFDGVRVQQVSRIFRGTTPGGGTNIAKALKEQLNDYFARREVDPTTKPLAIAIITDGVPNSARALKNTIIDATKKMQRPDEIAITFLQVGMDPSGMRLLQDLDYDLPSDGAQFDIVSMKPFAEVMRLGLPRALAQAVR